MNATYLDFAQCRCGYRTPIRPSKPVIPNEDQEWTGTDDEFLFVACSECKWVYSVETKNLVEAQSLWGLEPYNPGAPMRLFPVSLPCDEAGCGTQLPVIAVRKSNTSAAALQAEIANWHTEGLRCPQHPISKP